jgi:Lysylphosphatidylglycerol synthase TM region
VAGLAGRQVRGAVGGLEDARPIWLWAAAFCFVGSLLASSSVWRSALGLCGGRISRSDAAACYSLGSLVNGVTPVRIGEAVRLTLFARRLEGDDRAWRMGGVFTVIAAIRLVVFGIVIACAAAVGAVPLRLVFLVVAVGLVTAAVAYVTRNRTPRTHVAHLLDAFRALGRSPLRGARIAAWIAASTAARFFGAAAIAAALGVNRPVLAALIILAALDLAGVIPLSGNVGITSGAVTMALQSHGVGLEQALSTGLAFHAVETMAGIACGVAGVFVLGTRKRVFVLAAAGAAACLAAAFCATVLVPLA